MWELQFQRFFRTSSDAQVSTWRQLATEAREALSQTQEEKECVLQQQMPALQEENARARNIIAQLEAELRQQSSSGQQSTEHQQQQLMVIREEMQRLAEDNALLKSELQKTVQASEAVGC